MSEIIKLESVTAYNAMRGIVTLHPLIERIPRQLAAGWLFVFSIRFVL